MPASTEDPGSAQKEEPPSEEHLGARREFLFGAGVVVAVTGFVGGKRLLRALAPQPTRAECEELLARWLNHASRQHDPLVDDADVRTAEQIAREQPDFVADLDRCEGELTQEEVQCGIGAPNADALERCVQ